MREYRGYVAVSHGPISKEKLRKVSKTGKISFTADELKGNTHKTLFHPSNASKIKAAKSKKKGVNNLEMSGGEIMADMDYHRSMGAGMHGGSIWDTIKDWGSKAWNWVKDSGVASVLADAAADVARPIIGDTATKVARDIVKTTTGVGLREKRLAALAKARSVKASKKSSGKVSVMDAGSFLSH